VGTVFSIGLAYFFYRKQVRAKLLAIDTTLPVSLTIPMSVVPEDYARDGKERWRVFVLLWNRGSAPLEMSDFVEPIKVLPAENILRMEVHEQDPAANVRVDQTNKTISVELLRPGEAAILVVDAEAPSFSPGVSVVMKSADMSTLIRREPQERRDVIAGSVAIAASTVVYAGLMWMAIIGLAPVVKARSGLDLIPILVGVGAVPVFFGGVRLYGWLRKEMLPYTPFVLAKFFYIKGRCADIHSLWNSLRTASGGLLAMG
jgi:hypothetical protein